MNNLFHLDLGDALPGLIWMVILVIWFVGKVISAAGGKKGKRPSTAAPPPARPRKPEAADELREFLETLTGQKLELPEEKEQPVQPAAPMPPPVAPVMPARPRVQPAKRPEPLPSMTADEIAPAMVGLPASRADRYQPTQIPGMKTLLLGLGNLRIAGSSMPAAQRSSSAPGHINAELHHRNALRRGMIQRIVLGPPVALGGKASSPDLPEF